jgi:hypothetical protein
MSEALNVNVLVSAKEEYTQQLCYVLSPLIYQGVVKLFDESKLMPKTIRGISYRNFQITLANIQNWSSFIIEKETKRIKELCTYLSDLVTAIFVSHVKILACVRMKGDHKNIKIKIPNMEIFIHKIYILVGNKIYNNVNIINESEEYVIRLISDTINECIRKQLPIEHILNEYLFDVFNDVSDDESEKSNSESSKIIKGEDIAESDNSDNSDAESEYIEENKHIPTIPIDGSDHKVTGYPPNFSDDITKLKFTDSHMNTPLSEPLPQPSRLPSGIEDFAGLPEQANHQTVDDNIITDPGISSSGISNPSISNPSISNPSISGSGINDSESRPLSPVTLFGDARSLS